MLNRTITKLYNGHDVNVIAAELQLIKPAKKPGLWKAWTQKKLNPEKPRFWKTWNKYGIKRSDLSESYAL